MLSEGSRQHRAKKALRAPTDSTPPSEGCRDKTEEQEQVEEECRMSRAVEGAGRDRRR